jgi:hypothetical protein
MYEKPLIYNKGMYITIANILNKNDKKKSKNIIKTIQ